MSEGRVVGRQRRECRADEKMPGPVPSTMNISTISWTYSMHKQILVHCAPYVRSSADRRSPGLAVLTGILEDGAPLNSSLKTEFELDE